jgi:hypothetical protein
MGRLYNLKGENKMKSQLLSKDVKSQIMNNIQKMVQLQTEKTPKHQELQELKKQIQKAIAKEIQSKYGKDLSVLKKYGFVSKVNSLTLLEVEKYYNEDNNKVRISLSGKGPLLVLDFRHLEVPESTTGLNNQNTIENLINNNPKILKEVLTAYKINQEIETENNYVLKSYEKRLNAFKSTKPLIEVYPEMEIFIEDPEEKIDLEAEEILKRFTEKVITTQTKTSKI